jgi:hypothetical protein
MHAMYHIEIGTDFAYAGIVPCLKMRRGACVLWANKYFYIATLTKRLSTSVSTLTYIYMNKRKCAKCQEDKNFIFKEVQNGVAISVDDTGKRWYGFTCNYCYNASKPKKPIIKKDPPKLNTSRIATCKSCGQNKNKVLAKIYPNGVRKFTDELGSWWNGARCPSCEKARMSGEHKKEEVICPRCSKVFTKLHKNHLFCSPECRNYKPPKVKKEKPAKPKKVIDLYKPGRHCKLYIKTCETCSTVFTTSQAKAKACKRSHGISAKRAKKRRKWAIERLKQPISRAYREEIADIYEARPQGMQVDHIVPLNGLNVSGLHVPWNLQYLSPEDNLKKSNKT